jgi:hypothetical protein
MTNRYLPSIFQLFQLREKVINSEEEHEVQLSQLLILRKNVATCLLLQNGKPLSSAEPFFFDAWKIFSTFPPGDDCYLPPLYKSNHLNSILKAGVKCLLEREVGRINGCDNNVGHLVLGGVKGAGKTTLMRALALGAAALLQKMIPISHDYLKFKKPEELIWESLLIYCSVQPDSEVDPLDVLSDHSREAFLLLDEFQHNFRFDADTALLDGKDAAVTFHRYSRTYGTYGIIGGSSVDMHSLMFKQGRGEATDYWRQRGYPDFNGTLYELYTVPALRTAESLKDYIQVRYPLWELAEKELSLLLAYTGGIGRWVNKVWDCCCYDQERLGVGDGRYRLCDEEHLRQCTSYRKMKYGELLDNADNRELIAYLLLVAQPGKDPHGNIINCGGVERALLLQELKRVGISSPSEVVRAAEALSIIYIDMDSRVQFSLPVDAVIYRNEMPHSVHRLLLLSAVHLMVCGICNDDSGDVTDVNARNALEELVRENVYKTACINEHALFDSGSILTIKDGVLCLIKSTNELAVVPLTIELLVLLNLKHISWKKEHGLDGICFEKDDAHANSWYLDAWQCKGGRWDVEIGGGNNSMRTALNNYKKKYQLKDVGDKQITEIVLKAQVGICLIVESLRRAIPGVIVKPRRLVVTTTKQCGGSCVQTVNSWQKAGGVVMEKDVLKHFGLNSRSNSDKALKSKFELRIESGCSWVVNSISESALRAVAKHLLVSSDTTSNAVALSANGKGDNISSCIIQ